MASVKGGAYTPSRGVFKGRTFSSYRQYRNALEREQGRAGSLYERQRRPAGVLREQVPTRLSPAERRTYERAWKAVELKRENPRLSRAEAARQAGTTPQALHRYVPETAWPSSYRRWDVPVMNAGADPSDFNVPGALTLDIRNTATASKLGRYLNAVKAALEGDPGSLRSFRSRPFITVEGVRYRLITDPDVLRDLYDAGELDIEYASGDVAA